MVTATPITVATTSTMTAATATKRTSVHGVIALELDHHRITATPLLVTRIIMTTTVVPVTSTERTSEIRALVVMDTHRPLVTVIGISVSITNTMIPVTDTRRTSVVRTTVPGLYHRTITAILLVQMICTRIVDPAMGIKSTWVVRAHALASDLATTVTTLSVPFTSTAVLVTDTTSTWVVQTGALGQDRPTAAATTGTAQITFTAPGAMKTENWSTLPLTVLECDPRLADIAITLSLIHI